MDLSSFKLPKNFRGKPAFYVLLWDIVYVLFFAPSPKIFYAWRRFLLKCFGAKIGKKVLIRPSVRITYPWKVEIGDYSWIGDDVVLYSLGSISIGSNSVVSQNCYLCTGNHDFFSQAFTITQKSIVLGNQSWLAFGTFVSPGVNIGDRCFVRALSKVNSDIKDGTVL